MYMHVGEIALSEIMFTADQAQPIIIFGPFSGLLFFFYSEASVPFACHRNTAVVNCVYTVGILSDPAMGA